MQFREVFIEGDQRFVFVLTKHEVAVFKHATRGKKAPTDESIVHFDCSSGTVWATDRTQLVACVAKADYEPKPAWPDREFACDAVELQKFHSKFKVTQLLVIDTVTRSVGVIEKLALLDGSTIAPERLGCLSNIEGSYDLKTENMRAVLEGVPDNPDAGVGRFVMSSRFGYSLAAIAKATGDGDALIFIVPPNRVSGARWIVEEPLDGSSWDLVAMPKLERAVRATKGVQT